MSIVLYDQNKAVNTTNAVLSSVGGTGGGGYGSTVKDELDKIDQKIERLRSGKREKKYLGLSNQGATCYMNSAI